MVDLPAGSEVLSWIISKDPTQLLLIPGLHPASIAAAAGGDQQALAHLRFTAQHFAAYSGTHILTRLDRACLALSKCSTDETHKAFFEELQEQGLEFANLVEARLQHTHNL